MIQTLSPLPEIYAVLFGLILGSFFNVLIWRLPRGESIVTPRSRCPGCGRPIRAIENIPIISYLALRGRCAGCAATISIRYPIVEAITGALALGAWLAVLEPAIAAQQPWWSIAHRAVQVAVLLLMVPVTFIDIDHYIIPNSFTIPGLAIGAALAFMPGDTTPLNMVLGVLAGGGTLWLFGKMGEWIFRKEEAMGLGDVKMMAWVGALWGWEVALLSILFASFVGSVAGVAMMLGKVLRRDHHIPFGPFLAGGLWIAVLWGEPIVRWYLSLTDKLILP